MNEFPTTAEACSAAAFEAKYREHIDPWSFATSAYERRRYAATLQALTRNYYDTAFEPGCSIGELTASLASRCRRVIATDVAPSAVTRARQRCKLHTNVDFYCADVATHVPASALDLVVFSEIGYYFTVPQLIEIGQSLAERLQTGGELVAVHWLGASQDHRLHGNTVHETLIETLPLNRVKGHEHAGFRIDSWTRT